MTQDSPWHTDSSEDSWYNYTLVPAYLLRTLQGSSYLFSISKLTIHSFPTDQEMQETGSIEEETTKSEGSVEERKPRYKNIMHLWEFLLELLADEKYRSLITWSRKAHGEFKLKNQEEVAKRWGNLKQRSGMNYEKLSRALRHYYSQGIIQKVSSPSDSWGFLLHPKFTV